MKVVTVLLLLLGCTSKNVQPVSKVDVVEAKQSWWKLWKLEPPIKDPNKACDDGRVAGCFWIGSALEKRGEFDAAYEIFNDLCSKHEFAPACYNQSIFVSRKLVKNIDATLGYSLAVKACQLGSIQACGQIGYLKENGIGTALDIESAAAQYKSACDIGDVLACNNLAYMFRKIKKHRSASSLYRKACSLGYLPSCYREVWLKVQGCSENSPECDKQLTKVRTPEQDAIWRKKLVRLSKAYCDSNKSSTACTVTGIGLASGVGIDYDSEMAAEYAKKACDTEDAWGCNELGNYYRKGVGVVGDDDTAAAHYKKSCELGFEIACRDYATMHLNKDVSNPDVKEAKKVLSSACQRGVNAICEDMIYMCSADVMPCR